MGMDYAQDDSDIKAAWENSIEANGEEQTGICLVTGERTEIARIHRGIKGVPGAQSSGAALVSFNAPAFESYGKEQSYNAPVGKYAEFAYTTALNYLLSKGKHIFIGRFHDCILGRNRRKSVRIFLYFDQPARR